MALRAPRYSLWYSITRSMRSTVLEILAVRNFSTAGADTFYLVLTASVTRCPPFPFFTFGPSYDV